MQIISIDGYKACCEARGVRRDVSLTLVGDRDIAVGDHVLVHVGYALQTITAAQSEATWDLFDEVTHELARHSA